jgi:hypothetical protein
MPYKRDHGRLFSGILLRLRMRGTGIVGFFRGVCDICWRLSSFCTPGLRRSCALAPCTEARRESVVKVEVRIGAPSVVNRVVRGNMHIRIATKSLGLENHELDLLRNNHSISRDLLAGGLANDDIEALERPRERQGTTVATSHP